MEHTLSKMYFLLAFLNASYIECNWQSPYERQLNVATDDEERNNGALSWTCPFKDSTENFNESEKWYNFLNNLYCKFSEYKIQIAKRNPKVNDILDYKKQDCAIEELIDEVQRTGIIKNNFERFLNETFNCNITAKDSVENIVVSELEFEELNHVLNLTLRYKLHVDCEGTQVFIKGNYITTGDISDILRLRSEINDDKCKNLLSNNKNKFVNIFALNTFFIDASLNSSFINSHKVVLMSVIAPKWETIGKNKIELDGEDGELPEIGRGIDGKPGKPGSPGRNFFGIGRVFINGKNLEISVNGGNGSYGQDGKKGENGIDGISLKAPPSGLGCNDRFCEQNEKIKDFDCKRIECKYDYGQRTQARYYKLTRYCIYELFGKTGTKGRNGGKGGKGGKGGYPGNIVLIELKNHSAIYLFTNTGKDGEGGKGGNGGFGGKKGSDITVKCENSMWSTHWRIESIKPSNELAESGENGTDGGDANETPNLPAIINDLDKAKIINQFKSYLRENLHDRFTNSFLIEFLNQLEADSNVKKVYNTLGLIDELQHLEEQFHILNKDLNFIPFYQSLLSRINEYAYAPKEVGDPMQYKKILCYLYTAALSKIHSMQDNVESNLIIDIYAHLRSVKSDIDKLKDLQNAKYKDTLINKYKEEYKHEIDIKINESNELISKEIIPEIDSIGTEIDNQMKSLVDEVIHLQEKTVTEQKLLIEKQKELESKLGIQGIVSVFKIFGAVVSFLGPIGAVAGAVIETGTTVADPFLSDDSSSQIKIFELPQSVSELQSINDRIYNIFNQKINCLQNSLESISLEVIKHPDILSNMSFKILSIKYKLDKLDKKKLNFKEIDVLEQELDAEIQKQEEMSDRKNATQLAIIKNMKKIVQLSTLLSDSYNKYKSSREKLDTISNAIDQNEEKLRKLNYYEQEIFNSILPMLENIEKDLQSVISKLGTKSKVALDVTKWHVKSTLRDVMLVMQKITRGFEAEDNLVRCVEKLKDAMDSLINVHEDIRGYQKDQNLSSYIAEISSIAVSDIIVGNNAVLQEELRKAVRNLEITIRSNIVLQRYKIGINAFKQFVFPFAHRYFKDLILPSHLAISDDEKNAPLENLISKAATEIEKINSKLEDYKNTVINEDGCIGLGGFQSGYVSGKPFFVWKNEHYNSMISKLLSGDTVVVKADVRNSSPFKDAIKFNIAQFNFTSKNATIQSEINNKLKGFELISHHLGNSNYRYENKIYEMMSASREIWYHFEKKANGEPYHYSNSYKKIMDGNVTLSPYASWTIKLDNVTDDISFKDLESYKDSVDLTLEGNGYFLNKKSSNCIDLMVDKYYKAIGTCYYAYSNVESHAVDIPHALENSIFQILIDKKVINKTDNEDLNYIE